MAIEIERKYLVRDESWRIMQKDEERLMDGFIASNSSHKVRVRTYGSHATITIKTVRIGLEREEFEFPIPLIEAIDLLSRHCGDNIIDKIRHYVIFDNTTWEINTYEGDLKGIILAEVELPDADAVVSQPPWLGQEVTFDPNYRTSKLIQCARARSIARAACRTGFYD